MKYTNFLRRIVKGTRVNNGHCTPSTPGSGGTGHCS
jgi:hypothetical protein